jgi:hypothetical protein
MLDSKREKADQSVEIIRPGKRNINQDIVKKKMEKDGALLADLKRGIRRWCELSFTNRPVRIWVRIGPSHPQACRKRRLNGAVLRMRSEKPRPHVTASVAR